MIRRRLLTHGQARNFYDAFGARQDRQGFYETPALDELTAHLDFGKCHAVFEFGCGTGKFAQSLFETRLLPDARYVGIDISHTMTTLAEARLARYGQRAEIRETEGSPAIDLPDRTFDRFISTYVLDLLAEDEIRAIIKEAHRVLVPGGLLGLVSLTNGETFASRAVSALWRGLHWVSPRFVGGCRPVEILSFIPANAWELRHRRVVTPFAIPSEVVVAART